MLYDLITTKNHHGVITENIQKNVLHCTVHKTVNLIENAGVHLSVFEFIQFYSIGA